MRPCTLCKDEGFYVWACRSCGKQQPVTERLAEVYGVPVGSLLTEADRTRHLQQTWPKHEFKIAEER